MAQITAIVFDFDNTLVDFHTMKFVCSDAGIEKMINRGLPATLDEAKSIRDEVFRNYGWEDPRLFWHIAEFCGVKEPVSLERYAQLGKTAYRKRQRDYLAPYDGVPATLAKLTEGGIALAVLSDAPRLKVFDRLCDSDLEPYFEDRVVGKDKKQRHLKPSPRAFKRVLDVLERETPEGVLMVGDHPVRDILGAKTYGFQTAWAKYGYTPKTGEQKDAVQTRADYVLEHFTDLSKIVQ